MGTTGTEIAKSASDIILLVDNFSIIATAIVYGKNLYDSIYKFINFILTTNFATMIFVFLGAAILG